MIVFINVLVGLVFSYVIYRYFLRGVSSILGALVRSWFLCAPVMSMLDLAGGVFIRWSQNSPNIKIYPSYPLMSFAIMFFIYGACLSVILGVSFFRIKIRSKGNQ